MILGTMTGLLPTLGQGAQTLGAPQQQDESLAQLLALYKRAEEERKRGAELGQAEYINNSGAVGVLGALAQAWKGKQIRRKADEDAVSLTDRILTAQSREKAAEAERERAAKDAERDREVQRKLAILRRGDPAEMAANGVSMPEGKAPQLVNVPDGRGGTRLMENTPDGLRPLRRAGQGGYAPAQQPAGASGFEAHIGPLLKREGGFVANDAGAGPTNFGINARANPDVDVRGLTQDKAAALYRERYWNAIGADSLPPELQATAFDAAVNQGPARALQWIKQSGGDPAKFNALRAQHYQSLVQSNPQKYGRFAEAWTRRLEEVSGAMGAPQGGEATATVAGSIRAGDDFGYAPPKQDGARDRFRRLSPAEVAREGLPPGTVAQLNEATGAVSVLRAAPTGPGKGAAKLSGETANKVGLFDNAIRAAQAWHALVAEKDEGGNYTGGYNNMAAASTQARQLLTQAIRAKLRAESGATITEEEIDGELDRYGSKWLGGDATDLQAANALLKDLVHQRRTLLQSAGIDPGGSRGKAPPPAAGAPRVRIVGEVR